MENKIVVVFLICLVLGEISNIQARITFKKSRRERFLREEGPKAHLHQITEAYKSCSHNCLKPCPQEDEQRLFECELRCDKSCSAKQHRRVKEGSEKQNGEKGAIVEEPKPNPVTRVHAVCYDECATECGSDDVKCLKKCYKNCNKVSEVERTH